MDRRTRRLLDAAEAQGLLGWQHGSNGQVEVSWRGPQGREQRLLSAARVAGFVDGLEVGLLAVARALDTGRCDGAMQPGLALMAAHGIDVTQDTISGADFEAAGLPMVVACTTCEMTMALPSCVVDDDGHFYCRSCGGVKS